MGGCQRKQLEDFGFRIADLELRALTYEMWDVGRHGVSGETSETGKDDIRQRTGDRSQKSEERYYPVGAAFSRDSNNFYDLSLHS